ncbi:hypothetical protein [Nostoc sp. 'Peltigera membranacea cyanobiont' 232]|nr:hypothetical protein [Nostoc sp. 'Peltigera membranacea cyanobiont' 232]
MPSSYKRAKHKLKRSPPDKEGDRFCQKGQSPQNVTLELEI